ncbi:MAG: hypothetical protein F6J98_29340 [Moorea sp. SIO4G2]|nr:hypothetical protein [Moorena sp. SIO4G2]
MPSNALCKLHYLSGALPTLHEPSLLRMVQDVSQREPVRSKGGSADLRGFPPSAIAVVAKGQTAVLTQVTHTATLTTRGRHQDIECTS